MLDQIASVWERVLAQPGANLYYAAAWKNPVAEGVSDTWTVELLGYAKRNSTNSPYCVPNEFVAGRIGSVIGLPLPPGAAIEGPADGQGPAWVSLSFTPSGERLPPVDGAQVGADLPEVAAGVVVFDILIANTDRHCGNLAYLPSKKRLEVFDHSHALAGISAGSASGHMAGIRDHFAISGISNRHCLLDHLGSASAVMRWVDEIVPTIRDSLIDRICSDAVTLGLGLSGNEADDLAALLKHRRDSLHQLVTNNRNEFTAIAAEEWGLI